MIEQASFTLRNRNPDVLTCIANLSNDEVFTPPELANQMLDTLAKAWASNNDGENLWANKNVKFLDPCTKENARDASQIGHWGTGDLELSLSTFDHLEKAKVLIVDAYEGKR